MLCGMEGTTTYSCPTSFASSRIRAQASTSKAGWMCVAGLRSPVLASIPRISVGEWPKYPANSTSSYPIAATRSSVGSTPFSISERTV